VKLTRKTADLCGNLGVAAPKSAEDRRARVLLELLLVFLMDTSGAPVNADNKLRRIAGHCVAAYGVREITEATPVFVAVSRHKYLCLAPFVAAGVAPVPRRLLFAIQQMRRSRFRM